MMRKIWMGLSTVVLALGLVACGGGGGGGGDSGGGLEAVYDKVNAGSTYEEVSGLTGYGHNAGESAYPDNTTLYTWKAGEGTGQEMLGVQFNNSSKRAMFKVYVSGSKNRSTGL
jgi:hypothetical protein